MADYFCQMVISPDIPLTAMTALEYRILGEMFETEMAGEDVYFFASHGPNDFFFIEIAEARRLLEADAGITSSVRDIVIQELAGCDPDALELELDMSTTGFEGIFQDIVRRSALGHVGVEAAWTCSKMRPDGFGGAATLITADAIESISTSAWLDESLARLDADKGPD